MEKIENLVKSLKQESDAALAAAKTEQELEAVRVDFLGRQGRIAGLMESLKTASLDEKRILGPALNELKQHITQRHAEKKEALEKASIQQQLLKKQYFDVTASLANQTPAHLHVYTHLIQELENIFISMGYKVADGPEVETEYHNFEALNIPKDHPARDMQDTFWLTLPNMLLRTHTSNVQVRQMEQFGPPLAIFATGRTYRHEAVDAKHDLMFSQGEVLLVDKNVSMAQLLATAQTFLQAIFNKKDLKMRVRTGYFPFVEPGIEIDASCPFCTKGCSVCKQTTWIELLGAGLVHPNVLKCGGIDTEKYSGFAMGFGLERIAMIRYGINDIRLFHSSKIPFLDQF
ncbi:phenylalanine--tRNA ligase subunit alpha [Candidatus Dependentiae bacterium HGW-Dependentiae-1]|nr:MAG: phenylalanine--tRNA ligase subunit alpha [Candidatus Dependentiae bacterium HGW-Dependentiae-1]